MKMKILICTFFILCVSSATFGEEAKVLPAQTLRYTQPLYFGFQTEDIEDKTMALGWGIGLEYGAADWVNLQILWNPGFWGVVDGGNFAPFSDMFAGVKTCVLGENALIPKPRFMRLSTAAGIKMPVLAALYEPPKDSRSPDHRLWGSVLQVYTDFLLGKYFFVNMYGEGIYYPPQRSRNPVFTSEVVKHYLDLTGELEARFEVPLEGKGITLKGGALGRYFYAPWMNAADDNAGNQSGISMGGHFDVFLTELASPIEISAGYSAPIRGRNINPVHRVSLTFKIYSKKPIAESD